AELITTLTDRASMPLGARPELLIKILSRQVFLGAVEGIHHPLAQITDQSLLLSAAVLIAGLAILIWTLYVGPLELRCFAVFGFSMFASALMSPLVSENQPQWEAMIRNDGGRYWLLPMLVFVAGLVRLLGARALPL